LRSVSRCRITPQLSGRQSIARAFSRFYEGEAEIDAADDGMKLVDAQGHTLIKSAEEVKAARKSTSSQPAVAVKAPPPPPDGISMNMSGMNAPPPASVPRSSTLGELPTSMQGKSPADMLRAIEEAQRKEVTALKGMVELLIEKGVFTREEYLARVKR
jgi:hypothetical protein